MHHPGCQFTLAISAILIIVSTCPLNVYGQALLPRDSICDNPPNPIVAENCKTGTGDWHITNDFNDIEGYASETSIIPGDSIDFLINTRAAHYNLMIYRSGYYGGAGGRLIQSVMNLPGRVQSACHYDSETGLTSCSNWSVSYHLQTARDWVSGVYLVKLARPDTGGENYFLFVVRDDTRHSNIVLKISTNTYEAYNFYGNKCFYSSISPNYCLTISGAQRSVKVSYDRPDILPYYSQDSYFWTDYPIVNWLEAQGYDVSYITDLDAHQDGAAGAQNNLLDHRIFFSVGHDEYWSQQMRGAVTAARDAGVNLAFFSANVSYWRVRMEPDPWTGKPNRVIVCYKTTESGPPDPSGEPTTTWRDPQGANDPENSLVGQQYLGANEVVYFPLRIPASMAQDRIYRNTGLQNMPPGTYVEIGKHLIGFEWDSVADNGKTPQNLTILSASPVYGELLVDAGRKYKLGEGLANMTRYIARSGSIVFASGTTMWGWGLAVYEPDSRIQQITYNLLADTHVFPATPAQNIISDISAPFPAVVNHNPGYDPLAAVPIEKWIRVWAVPDFNLAKRNDPASPTKTVFKQDTASNLSITNPQVLQITFDSAVLAWTTNRPSNSQVWVSLTPGIMDWSLVGKTMLGRPVTTMVALESVDQRHRLTITGLLPGTLYYYQIISMDANGKIAVSAEGSIRTQTGGPLWTQAKEILRPFYRTGECLYAAYPGPVLGLGSLILAAALFIGWRVAKGKKLFG